MQTKSNNLLGFSVETLGELVDLLIAKQSVDTGRPAPRLLCNCRSTRERVSRCREFALWARAAEPEYWTQQQIAEFLNDRGQTTSRGAPWSQASVSYLLRAAGGDR